MHNADLYSSEGSQKILSNTIDWLRFPMALMVIFIHQKTVVFSEPETFSEYTFNIISSCFSRVLPYVAVPLFFLISGYLYFLNIETLNIGLFKKKSISRIKNILLPYLYWNLIDFGVAIVSTIIRENSFDPALHLIRHNGLHIFWDSDSWSGGWWCFGMLSAPNDFAPFDSPLWFMRNLIILFALTPAIHYIIKRAGKTTIFVLGAAFLTNIWIQYSPLCIRGIFFFTLGCYLSINKHNLAFCFKRACNIATPFAIAFGIICTLLYAFGDERLACTLLPIYTLSGVLCAIYIASSCCKGSTKILSQKIIALAPTSFFIFAIHAISINSFCGRFILNILHNISFLHQDKALIYLIAYPITILLVTVTCLTIFYMMKRLTPHLLSALTGNRM